MQIPKDVTICTDEQGSEAWLRSRLGKFTASRAGDLMKLQKNGQPYATRKNYITEIALERITQRLPEQIESEHMRNGKELERVSALAYSFETRNETEQTGFWHKDFYGASPDDLIVGQNGGVEYKNPMASTHHQTLKDGVIPEYYYWQIVQCMLLTQADFWDYVSHNPDFPVNAQLFIKRVTKDEVQEDLGKLVVELEKANQEAEEQITFIKNYKRIV